MLKMVLESDLDLRKSKEDMCTPLTSYVICPFFGSQIIHCSLLIQIPMILRKIMMRIVLLVVINCGFCRLVSINIILPLQPKKYIILPLLYFYNKMHISNLNH